MHVAEGGALTAAPPPTIGHSIEVRLYAEDPAHDWQPQSGTLHRFSVPGVNAQFEVPADASAAGAGTGAGLRLDSGVVDGSVVGIHYDPMLAKVISWAPRPRDAARRLATALPARRSTACAPTATCWCASWAMPEFLDGDTDTAFLDRHGLDVLAAPLADERATSVSALAGALAMASSNRRDATVLGDLPSGWRNIVSQPQHKAFRPLGGAPDAADIDVAYRLTRDGLHANGHDDVVLVDATPSVVVLHVDGVRRRFDVAIHHGLVCVDSALGSVALEPISRFPDAADQTAPGSLLAPMPGAIVRVAVEQGDHVERGQALLWLEAMKMQHQISAPVSGVVTELHITEGQQVDVGAVLAVVTEEST